MISILIMDRTRDYLGQISKMASAEWPTLVCVVTYNEGIHLGISYNAVAQ